MKSSAVILLIVALLASIALSIPTEYKEESNHDNDFYKYCKDIVFNKPVDGIIYKINSTQVADFVIPEDCINKFGMEDYSFFTSLNKINSIYQSISFYQKF